jgi:putative transposase
MPDHIHCFFGLKPRMAISDLVRDIKNNSSKFINERGFIPGKFECQGGFGAFSYSPSHVDNVYNYILNQERHHRKKSFKNEYITLLHEFVIEHKPEYLFDWIE